MSHYIANYYKRREKKILTHFSQMHNMDVNSALGSISSLVDIVHVNCLPQNIAKIYSQGFFVFKQGVMHEYCNFN
ncbi:MAG: hypothetical protein CSA18_04845 [Deltaproteobacteria bacterium]|nr:MAG: hypothetical protein CSA18_04845 [Deltaproteobacteria bacterium]